ncbi:helicase-related protein, partial [Bacillus pumilus]|uniref:helicase-related protein n=1 Tax=Bacillus pumilus TaxID=1408 RepID=UPI000B6ECEF2
NEYLDPLTGQPSPIKGALQLVFCDIGTPNPDRWNAYDELALQLNERGVPGERIRFMHEANNDSEKARLFAQARAGHISVLIGSTEKMGVGTNVQARAVALWHMDCPWRPADLAQRDGRILRQGNQNEEIAIVRFVTERSFDAFMWQTIERKATFIAQVMRGRLDSREIDEIDPGALSAAEAKALSSGNPLLLEHSTLTSEVAKLRRLQRAHET